MQTQTSTQRTEGTACAIQVVLGVASPVLLRGLEVLIGAMPGLDIAGTGQTMKALLALLSGMRCDVVIVGLPIERDLLEVLLPCLKAAAPSIRVILIAEAFQPFAMREALKMGASGLISKTAQSDEILAAVRSAASDRSYVAPEFATRLAEAISFEELTHREMQVLGSLSRGGCNKAIARDLDVSIGTVKTHVRAIMGKLDSRSRTDVAIKALRFGLVGLEP
jgi:DNA-binding NarL/FixJ family response regulator